MKLNWTRPFRRYGGADYRMLSSSEHLSCWDCEHIRVAGMPARMCVKHPRTHIYGPGPVDYEARNEGDMGRQGSVADRCKDFNVASEFTILLPIDEEPL